MKVKLAEWVRALKAELRIAAAALADGPPGSPILKVEEIELEAVIETQVDDATGVKASVWVLEGEANSTRSEKRQSTVRIKLRPKGDTLVLGDAPEDKV